MGSTSVIVRFCDDLTMVPICFFSFKVLCKRTSLVTGVFLFYPLTLAAKTNKPNSKQIKSKQTKRQQDIEKLPFSHPSPPSQTQTLALADVALADASGESSGEGQVLLFGTLTVVFDIVQVTYKRSFSEGRGLDVLLVFFWMVWFIEMGRIVVFFFWGIFVGCGLFLFWCEGKTIALYFKRDI